MHRKSIIVVLLLSVCLAFVGNVNSADLPKGILTLDGKPAPVLKLRNIDGDEYDIASHRGRWLFVHFWATWCGPCRKEMPTIQSAFKKIDQDKLEVVLVNTAESEDMVFSFLASVAPDLIPLMDSDGQATEVWQPRGLPATFLVDPHGKLRFLALGGRPWDQAEYLKFLQGLYLK